MLKRPSEEHPLGIEIKDNNGWKLIGNCGFFDINWRTRCAEVGIFIGEKSCWNKGYGTEVMQLMLRHGFETLNLNRIILHVDADNLGGIRAYEKAGFIHEARLRQANFREGKYCDDLIMSVLCSEWNPDS
jgi:RimJ/RimL family protein N-acetyltransferase